MYVSSTLHDRPTALGEPLPALLELRCVSPHPTHNGRMGQRQAAFDHHLRKVSQARPEAKIPAHAQDDVASRSKWRPSNSCSTTQLAHDHPSGSSADIIAGQILPFAPEPVRSHSMLNMFSPPRFSEQHTGSDWRGARVETDGRHHGRRWSAKQGQTVPEAGLRQDREGFIRKAAPRTLDAVSDAIDKALTTIPPDECANYLTGAGCKNSA